MGDYQKDADDMHAPWPPGRGLSELDGSALQAGQMPGRGGYGAVSRLALDALPYRDKARPPLRRPGLLLSV